MKIIEVEHTESGRILNIKFSNIKSTWVRRTAMLLALPFMIAFSLLFIAYAATRRLPVVVLWVVFYTVQKCIMCPINMWAGFAREWCRKPEIKD